MLLAPLRGLELARGHLRVLGALLLGPGLGLLVLLMLLLAYLM